MLGTCLARDASRAPVRHALVMAEDAIRAKVADMDGEIIGTDAGGIHWETEVPPEQLSSFIARCSDGAELVVVGPEGLQRVLTRRWWIWPQDGTVRIRLLLERTVVG